MGLKNSRKNMAFEAKHVGQAGKVIFIPDQLTLLFLWKLSYAKPIFFKSSLDLIRKLHDKLIL